MRNFIRAGVAGILGVAVAMIGSVAVGGMPGAGTHQRLDTAEQAGLLGGFDANPGVCRGVEAGSAPCNLGNVECSQGASLCPVEGGNCGTQIHSLLSR